VHRFVSLNRSPGRLELAKVLLGLHSSFDGSMILLQDIVQILDRSMSTGAAQDSFLFHCWNRRAVEARLIGVDDPGLFSRSFQATSPPPAIVATHPRAFKKSGLFSTGRLLVNLVSGVSLVYGSFRKESTKRTNHKDHIGRHHGSRRGQDREQPNRERNHSV
jgi:hypothetical protein